MSSITLQRTISSEPFIGCGRSSMTARRSLTEKWLGKRDSIAWDEVLLAIWPKVTTALVIAHVEVFWEGTKASDCGAVDIWGLLPFLVVGKVANVIVIEVNVFDRIGNHCWKPRLIPSTQYLYG
jgi:hypothetical protein